MAELLQKGKAPRSSYPADVLDYIRYKVAIMGDVFSYEECLEYLNDIMKEIAAFGPHQK